MVFWDGSESFISTFLFSSVFLAMVGGCFGSAMLRTFTLATLLLSVLVIDGFVCLFVFSFPYYIVFYHDPISLVVLYFLLNLDQREKGIRL